jgi:hypothetical protein
MTIIPLQLPPGIVRGANPDDAPGRWYDGNLVRWRDGVMEPVGGWERINPAPASTPVRKLHQWRDNKNLLHLVAGSDEKLRDQNEGAWSVITPADFVGFNSSDILAGYGTALYGRETFGTPRQGPTRLQPVHHAWSFANWGEDLLVVASSDGRLFQHPAATPGAVMTVVSGAPISNRGVLVTNERHAMLLQPGGEARSIGWCSRENLNDWDFASLTNTAGILPLHAESPLMSFTLVREGVLIWSETEAFLARYVGLPYIYGYDSLGSANLYAPNAFAEFDGKGAWMDQAGFMLYQGGSITTLPCPLADYVFHTIDPTWGPRNAHAYVNGVFNEIWWHYPARGSTECTDFVMWNYVENWWSMGKLSRSAGFASGAGPNPILGSPDGNIYTHETGWTYDGFDAAGNIYISSGTLNVADGEQAMHISQLIPSNGSNYDAADYTIYSRMTPAQAEAVNGPYAARPDGYVDIRAMGRDLRVRIAATRAGDWSIGRIRMKVATGGRR